MSAFRKPKEVKPEQALVRLEELCARSEHSTGEFRTKLRQWRIAPADAEEIIESLTARRFVDDSRFARAFVRDKYRFARWGRIKIRLQLRAKGVDSDTVAEALELIDSKEYSRILARQLVARMRRSPNVQDPAERQKIFRTMIAKGYEPSLIARAYTALLQYVGL